MSQSSVSISSTISALSYLLTTNPSGSQSEMIPEPQKDNMSEAPIYMTSLDYFQGLNKTPAWYMGDDTMASADHNVEGLLDRMVSFYAQELQQIDFEEYFLIEEELGKGGYGNVFLVNDKQTGQRMAMKVMDKDKTSQQSFLHEFSISYLLSSHQNIIGCFGFFFSTIDYFVFAQELAPDGDLFSMIFPNVGIPEDAAKRCAVQISSALEFISERGFVHMDLKPENVLVFDQDCHCVKITDFGLTKVTETVIRARCGSKSYMAPEMFNLNISDGLAVDGSLDVWAFGVVIYCLVTGEFPWRVAMLDDESYKQYVDWQNDFREVNPPETWEKVPAGIQRMFLDLLAIDRAKRSKTSVVLKYLGESWKEETPELTLTTYQPVQF
ncbi:serine/threonine-protein kinase SBK1-like [Aquarana catesbeiana]|uniref:serine/threonine-protein kinase SBK1-like n=1 Tax=Aquarana catesbeiana TaxID=8400 RepID=UPI003CC9964B